MFLWLKCQSLVCTTGTSSPSEKIFKGSNTVTLSALSRGPAGSGELESVCHLHLSGESLQG